jgi:hypothetical protein
MIFLILLGAAGFLLFLLYSDLVQGVLMTDGSGFMYVAQRMQDGAVLYKDIFLTNTPLIPYITWVYKTILFGSLPAYYLSGIAEVVITSFVLFFIAKQLYKHEGIAFITALLYLTSFTLLANLLPTGISTAILFMTSGYLLYLRNRFIFSAILFGLALSAKAYTAPIVFAFFIDAFLEKRRTFILPFIAFLLTGFAVMLPTILFAFPQFLQQTFGYSLFRQAGRDQIGTVLSFIKYDFLIVILNVVAVFGYKKNRFLSLSALFLFIFFIFYQDRHFMYFTLFIPFSVLTYGLIMNKLKKHIPLNISLISTGVLLCFIAVWHLSYSLPATYKNNRVTDTAALLNVIKKEKPDYIYGTPFMTQGLSYMTGVPVLDNIADTNAALFHAGKLNVDTITKRVFETKTLVFIASRKRKDGSKEYPANMLSFKRIPECKVIHVQPFRWSNAEELHVLKCYAD